MKEAKTAARRQAHARIEALLQDTLMEVDSQKLKAQTSLLAGNIEGKDAISFLESLPNVSTLMPKVTVNAHKLLEARPDPTRYNVVQLPDGLLSEERA